MNDEALLSTKRRAIQERAPCKPRRQGIELRERHRVVRLDKIALLGFGPAEFRDPGFELHHAGSRDLAMLPSEQ